MISDKNKVKNLRETKYCNNYNLDFWFGNLLPWALLFTLCVVSSVAMPLSDRLIELDLYRTSFSSTCESLLYYNSTDIVLRLYNVNANILFHSWVPIKQFVEESTNFSDFSTVINIFGLWPHLNIIILYLLYVLLSL